MGFPLKKILGTAAPWIATAIGGPMAGQAVAMAAKALGLKDDAKVDDVQAAVDSGQLTGDQLIALRKADDEFREKMQAAGFENVQKLEQIAADDRASARAREVAVKDKTPMVLAMAVTAGFFGVLLFMLLKDIPQQAHDVLMVMIGSLGTAWTGIVTYYFGSSAGSAQKTELLAKAASDKAQ